MTCTDHGSMAAYITMYNLAKKNKLGFAGGFEGYARDMDCDILAQFGVNPNEYLKFGSKDLKYMHFTVHYLDQPAYEMGCKLLSRADYEHHGSEAKPIFGWSQMEELAGTNTTWGSGCLIGMVQRHLMMERPDIAEAYYVKYRSIVKPENFYVEIFPHRCTHNWVHGIFATTNVQKHKFWAAKKLKTDAAEEVTAEDLSKQFGKKVKHTKLLGIYNNRVLTEMEEELVSVEYIEDFLENECSAACPDGDVQLRANRFLIEMARKYGDPCLWSQDVHIAYPQHKIVQDVRMAQSGNWRFANSYHKMSGDELWDYGKNVLGVSERDFEAMVDTGLEWGSRFKEFKLDYKPSLPTKFYPEDALKYTFERIEAKGRMRWDDPVWVKRLKEEIDMIHRNGKIDLLPYFFPVEEVVDQYNKHGYITAPGRGSAAGLALSYVLGTTHVDPIKHDLPYERFLTLDRILNDKKPDFDMDLPHKEFLVGKVEEYVEVEMEDGTVRKYRKEEKLQTNQGLMTIHEAIKCEADILEG